MPGYQITLAVEEDLRGIWRYTLDTWGPEQADKYLDQIENCFNAIGAGPVRSPSFHRLLEGVCVHRCRHHYIFWIVIDRPIIIAVLHEKMDVVQRLADRI